MVGILYTQHHGAIDAGSRVPTTVGYFRVVHIYADGIRALTEQPVGTDGEGQITIDTAAHFRAIDTYHRLLIDTLKVNGDMLL